MLANSTPFLSPLSGIGPEISQTFSSQLFVDGPLVSLIPSLISLLNILNISILLLSMVVSNNIIVSIKKK